MRKVKCGCCCRRGSRYGLGRWCGDGGGGEVRRCPSFPSCPGRSDDDDAFENDLDDDGCAQNSRPRHRHRHRRGCR